MDERETPTFEKIKHKLDRLKALDRHLQVFGAEQHQYKSYPLSPDEILTWRRS